MEGEATFDGRKSGRTWEFNQEILLDIPKRRYTLYLPKDSKLGPKSLAFIQLYCPVLDYQYPPLIRGPLPLHGSVLLEVGCGNHRWPTFYLDGHPLEKFALVANIRDMSTKTVPLEIQFEFVDGSGMINGFKSGTATGFLGLNDSVLPGYSGFNYVSLIGQLKMRDGAVAIQVIFIRAIEDAHEIYYHTLQVIFDAVRYERGNPTRRDWELAQAQAPEDSGSSVYEDAEDGEEDYAEAGPSMRHGRLWVIDVELSSDEEIHERGDTEQANSSDDSFNNITVTNTGRGRTTRSRPRESTSTRDSSRSVSPPRLILSKDNHIEQRQADLDIYTDGNANTDSESSDVEPVGGHFGVIESLPNGSPPSSPARSESSSVPPSPPGHYAYSDHERDLDAPTEDELEDAFQQHLEEEIVSSVRDLRLVATSGSGPSGSRFRGVQVFQVIEAIKAEFPGLPANTYNAAIERLIDNGILTFRKDDPFYVDVVQS